MAFLFVWLAGVVVICATGTLFAGFLAAAWGVICYSAARQIAKGEGRLPKVFTRGVVPPLAIFTVSWLLVALCFQLDPIGEATDNGPGSLLGGCMKHDTIVRNAMGDQTVLRQTECPIVFMNTIVSYYVFVHKQQQEENNRGNLVFRCTLKDGGEPPAVRWIGDSSLEVSTGPGWVDKITKRRTSFGDVRIVYHLGDGSAAARDVSLKRTLQRLAGSTEYTAVFRNLNGNGLPEAIVHMAGTHWCSGGWNCTVLILTQVNDSWRIVGNIPNAVPPIYVLAKTQNGWRSLGVGIGGTPATSESEVSFDGARYAATATESPLGEAVIDFPMVHEVPLYEL
jgi:hypothetical protein